MDDINILIDELPSQIEIENYIIDINCDFRYGIMFEQLINDKSYGELQKYYAMLDIYFGDTYRLVENQSVLSDYIIWFHSCGKKKNKKEVANVNMNLNQINQKYYKPPETVYDYDYDADLIYSAFQQQYHIDLNEAELHWWKFKALFNSLDENTLFKQIVHIRATDVRKIKNKDERQRINKLKLQYKIPVEMTEEEKLQAISDMMGGGF